MPAHEKQPLLAASATVYKSIPPTSLQQAPLTACGNLNCDWWKQCTPYILQAGWLAILIAACDLSARGTYEGVGSAIAQEKLAEALGGISGAYAGFATLAIFGSSTPNLEDFKRYCFIALLLGCVYSFMSALLTYKHASNPIERWIASPANFLANVPFSTENTVKIFDNVKKYRKIWPRLTAGQKAKLFLNFASIFICVFCTMIGFAGPLVTLICDWFGNSIGVKCAAIAISGIGNAPEAFFMVNHMISMRTLEMDAFGSSNIPPEQDNTLSKYTGYIKNPLAADASAHKTRTLVAILSSFIAAISYGLFSWQETQLSTSWKYAAAILAMIGPFLTTIKPIDTYVNQRFITACSYLQWVLCYNPIVYTARKSFWEGWQQGLNPPSDTIV